MGSFSDNSADGVEPAYAKYPISCREIIGRFEPAAETDTQRPSNTFITSPKLSSFPEFIRPVRRIYSYGSKALTSNAAI